MPSIVEVDSEASERLQCCTVLETCVVSELGAVAQPGHQACIPVHSVDLKGNLRWRRRDVMYRYDWCTIRDV